MTDNVITEFLRKRTIMSDFQLIEYIVNSENLYKTLPKVHGNVILSQNALLSLLNAWKNTISSFATFLEKGARSVLAKTEGVVLYRFDTKDKYLYQAALICEIFRYPGISKNSSHLDIRKLQEHIARLLKKEEAPLKLVIAWGQAKQTCGLLKTPGTMADLAEVFAIIQLSVILQAIKRIVGDKKKVRLTVLTGASRFATAFYPDLFANEEYDKQRQSIADYFNSSGEMIFQPYRKKDLTRLENEAERTQAFQENCLLVKPEHIERIYNHILFSINWPAILTSQIQLEDICDELKQKLFLISAWIKKSSSFETQLRRILVCLLRRKNPAEFFSQEKDSQNWVDLSVVMDAITRDSAKKYIALQYTDAGFDVNEYLRDKNHQYIRLTVHEKKDRPEIPAIFTLGKLGGNYLSQNITVYLDKRGKTHFKSLVEILGEHKVKAVFITKDCDKSLPLSWLYESQPLCFIESTCEDHAVPDFLKQAFNAWLEGMLEI